jgi:hypothetical protein
MHAVSRGRYGKNEYTDGTLRECFGYVFMFVIWPVFISHVTTVVSEGYDKTILSLVEITLNHVRDKLKGNAVNTWVMWATAQRVDLPMKLRTCVR